jgi:hypothetical protein
MGHNRRESSAPAMACLAMAFLLPTLYVVGYFAVTVDLIDVGDPHEYRRFRWRWLMSVYAPATVVESYVRSPTKPGYAPP